MANNNDDAKAEGAEEAPPVAARRDGDLGDVDAERGGEALPRRSDVEVVVGVCVSVSHGG